MLEWLIIGGGIHGTHLSHVLTAKGKYPKDRIRVLDPFEKPMARWEECTANTGMPFLRSPVVHHIDLNPFSLQSFAQTREGRSSAQFTFPYNRPSLEFFRLHCEHIIHQHQLQDLRLVGRASGLSRQENGGIQVETSQGTLTARRVALAISLSEQPAWPHWAREVQAAGATIHHIFEPGFQRQQLSSWSHAVVIGGGISGAQTAQVLAEQSPGTVTLLARHDIKEHQFDSDPGWIGPKFMDRFDREPDKGKRRAMIQGARHRGSMPPEVARRLRIYRQQGMLHHQIADVVSARMIDSGMIELTLTNGQPPLLTDCIILATGFSPQRPGGEWLERSIDALGLKCAACGYPIVGRDLHWGSGIYVSGPLAELELGPTSRNIVGARKAGERLAQV